MSIQDDRGSAAPAVLMALAVIGVVILGGAVAALETVDEGHEKVVKTKGDTQGTFTPGDWYFINPVTQSTESVDVRPQLYEMVEAQGQGDKANTDDSVKVITNDNMEVGVDVAVRYQITDSVKFYQEYKTKNQLEQRLIRSETRDVVYSEAGGMQGSDIANKESRALLKNSVEDRLHNEFGDAGVELLSVDIRGVHYPQEYLAAVEQKKIKQQEIEKAQYEVQVAQQQKERDITRAEAEAEQIRIEGEALRDNAQVLQLRYIQALQEGETIYVPSDGGFEMIKDVDSESDDNDGGN